MQQNDSLADGTLANRHPALVSTLRTKEGREPSCSDRPAALCVRRWPARWPGSWLDGATQASGRACCGVRSSGSGSCSGWLCCRTGGLGTQMRWRRCTLLRICSRGACGQLYRKTVFVLKYTTTPTDLARSLQGTHKLPVQLHDVVVHTPDDTQGNNILPAPLRICQWGCVGECSRSWHCKKKREKQLQQCGGGGGGGGGGGERWRSNGSPTGFNLAASACYRPWLVGKLGNPKWSLAACSGARLGAA